MNYRKYHIIQDSFNYKLLCGRFIEKIMQIVPAYLIKLTLLEWFFCIKHII